MSNFNGVDVLNRIMMEAAEKKLADIHFQKTQNSCRVRVGKQSVDIESKIINRK